MDKVITTALLTIAAVIASVIVVNTMVPALGRGSSSVVGSSAVSAEQIKTNVEIITVTAISTEIYVWVKNVGAVEILSIDDSDVFLKDVGAASFDRMPYEAPLPADDPCADAPANGNWWYCLEEGAPSWKPGNTVQVTIERSPAPSGEYLVRFVTSNGVSVEKTFSV